jgi:hypothetical protein
MILKVGSKTEPTLALTIILFQLGFQNGFDPDSITLPQQGQSGITVIGKFPRYIELAKEIGGKALNIPIEIYTSLSKSEFWEINQQFLDDAITNNDIIVLASSPSEADLGSFFRMELDYLQEVGYQIIIEMFD